MMGFLSTKEYLRRPTPESSEKRLLALPDGSWEPSRFVAETQKFREGSGVRVRVLLRPSELPALSDEIFSRRGSYEEVPGRVAEGKNLTVVIALKADRIVGFGVAEQRETESKIEIINVVESARRFSGLKRPFEVAGGDFAVGVGHVIAETLASALTGTISVDAAESGYIFISLGFQPIPGEPNRHLLRRHVDGGR